MGLDVFLFFSRSDDVDGPAKGGGAEDPGCGAFQDFNAFDVFDGHGEICRQVAGLRVVDVHAVEQDGNLVKGAPADGEVCLYAHRATLAHVDACGILQEVVYTLHGRAFNRGAVQYSHHSRRFLVGQRHPGAGHFDALHHHFAVGQVVFRLCRHRLRVGKRQGGDGQRADDHFAV